MTKRQRLVLGIMVFGCFFGVMCSTMTNVALPVLMKVFGISSARVQWVTNGYLLVNALMIPVSAYLIKRYSYRNLFLGFTIIFALGTLVGAMAPSFWLVVVGRMIQALGAGVMIPLVNVLAMTFADKHHRGRVMGLVGLAFNFSPIIGPTVAGFILDYLSWRYLFILLLPFTLLSLLLAWLVMPHVAKVEQQAFNVVGLVTCSFALLCMLMGLSDLGTKPLFSWAVLGNLLLGLGIGLVFVLTQRQSDHPFLNLSVLANWQYALAIGINGLVVATMFGNTILLPLLLQDVMKESAVVTGLVILPGALSTGLLSPVSGRFFDRYPARWLITYGIAVDLLGTAMQAFLGVHAGPIEVALWQWVRQFGIVMILIPIQTHALSQLSKSLLPDGVAVFNTTRQIFASFGMALVVAMVNLTDHRYGVGTSRVGIQVGFLTCFILLVVAIILGQGLRTERR
ncbi:DHA2 family efflux MFS transporter permease subunit [Limosilactobacillus ingluviei]|uniref:DHA2 family efflux MFS transporter permease subunit n=1 Tax=Limosilactobacillus ingluviei TaxID=148604 RepID=UPI0024B8E6D6|nr:DHA2 family efflux MFS transporter permease subunit [Limosilactobacillus ingluviei]